MSKMVVLRFIVLFDETTSHNDDTILNKILNAGLQSMFQARRSVSSPSGTRPPCNAEFRYSD